MATHIIQRVQVEPVKPRSLIHNKLSHSRVLSFVAKCTIMALLIVSFPSIRSTYESWSMSDIDVDGFTLPATSTATATTNRLSFYIHDMKNEGVLKIGDKSLFVIRDADDEVITSPSNDIVVVFATDLEQQNSIPNESIDFAFTNDFHDTKEFIDRTVKQGGFVAIQFDNDPKTISEFNKPSGYEIVYLRSFEYSTVLAMKKSASEKTVESGPKRRLSGYASERKKVALKKLEDVLLEPPRATSRISRSYLKRAKYLPDITKDSLASYSRRVFIDVDDLPKGKGAGGAGGGGGGTSWFVKNYPTRNLRFDMYKIDTVTEDSVPSIDISDWLRANVKEDEFVVMKAEAEVVEEMMKKEATYLVDELFLECKTEGISGRKNIMNRSRRAYWECLALYGKLRDEGVAVHQWWG